MANPTWTPPINGWRYSIDPDRSIKRLAARGRNFKLWEWRSELGNSWVFTLKNKRGHQTLAGHGSLEFCCAILDAALRQKAGG